MIFYILTQTSLSQGMQPPEGGTVEQDTVHAAVLVGALLFASKLGEETAERLGMPGFAGSIIVGLLLSNAVLGLVSPSDLEPALLLFIIGINFTLFLAGIEELSNPALLRPRLDEALITGALLASSTLVVALFSFYAWRLGAQESLAIGVTMALVSAGPLMKILLSRGMLGEREARLLRIGLMNEVSGLVLFNSLIQGFSPKTLLETAVFVALVYVIGRKYLDKILLFIERHMHVKEAPFAIVVALVTMTGYIAEMIGFNAAVTALLMGVFLSEYMEKRSLYLERIRAFTYGFLEPLFFIGIGVYAVRPDATSLMYTAVVLLLASAPKIVVTRYAGFTVREGLVTLAKGGVDAALLLALLQAHLIDESIYTPLLLALIVSTILSSSAYRVKARKPDILRLRLADLKLDVNIIDENESMAYAAKLVADKGAAVVVDRFMRPQGYIVAEDFVEIDPAMLANVPVRMYMRREVPIVKADATVADIVGDPTLIRDPIIAVVDHKGEIIGTITPRKLLELIVKSSAEEEASRKRVEQLLEYQGHE